MNFFSDIRLKLHDSKNEYVDIQALLRLKFQLRAVTQIVFDDIIKLLPEEDSKTPKIKTILIGLKRAADIFSGLAEVR